MPFAFQPVFLLSDGKRFGSAGRWESLRMDNSNYAVGTDSPAFECSEMSLLTAQTIQHMLRGANYSSWIPTSPTEASRYSKT